MRTPEVEHDLETCQRPWSTWILTLWASQGPENWKWSIKKNNLLSSLRKHKGYFFIIFSGNEGGRRRLPSLPPNRSPRGSVSATSSTPGLPIVSERGWIQMGVSFEDSSMIVSIWAAKGQLVSECPFYFSKFSKKPTKNLTNFCPRI